MTQYIIEESELKKIIEVLTDEGCKGLAGVCEKRIRSRPYTSASSDKVLDELESKRATYETALKQTTSCIDEFDRGLIEGKEVVCIILREWIKELRLEREQ